MPSSSLFNIGRSPRNHYFMLVFTILYTIQKYPYFRTSDRSHSLKERLRHHCICVLNDSVAHISRIQLILLIKVPSIVSICWNPRLKSFFANEIFSIDLFLTIEPSLGVFLVAAIYINPFSRVLEAHYSKIAQYRFVQVLNIITRGRWIIKPSGSLYFLLICLLRSVWCM